MSTLAHRLRWPIRLVGFLVALPLLTVAPELIEPSLCERIPRWVKNHKTDLPLTVDEFLSYPEDFRPHIFSALPAANRTTIMVAHLKWFAASESSLTGDQRQFLDGELLPFIASGAAFDESITPEQRDRAGQPVVDKMSTLFSKELTKRAVGEFNEPVALPKTRTALRIRLAEALRRHLIVSAQYGFCQCSLAPGQDYCSSGLSPEEPLRFCQNLGCAAPPEGCGFLLQYTCNGICSICYQDNSSCSESRQCCSGQCSYFQCVGPSPILINVQSNAAQDSLTSPAEGVAFDLTADGKKERVSWTQAGDPVAFLALDRNGNGVVDDGRELFGNFTLRTDGTAAENGYEALKDLDSNHDGIIDSNDQDFSRLRLWFDTNHNGYSEPDELKSLAQSHVLSISTAYSENKRIDRFGNAYTFEGTAMLDQNGHNVERRIFDVFLTTLR